jgi:hypothetical protein
MSMPKCATPSAIALLFLLGCGAEDAAPQPNAGTGGAGGEAGGSPMAGTGAGNGSGGTSNSGSGGAPLAGNGGMGGMTGGSGGSGGMAGTGDAGDGDGDGDGDTGPFEGEGDPWIEPAPKATCGDGDVPETTQGMGGDVRCNLSVHGMVQAPHFLSMAWYEHCAYVNGNDFTTVLDVSDSANPKMTAMLNTPGMMSNWETMKVSEESKLLAGYASNGTIVDVYDVSEDCTDPAFLRSYDIGGSGHSGNFSTDGTIYYASSLYTGEVFALDVTLPLPEEPRIITSMYGGKSTHDLFIGKNGTRGYFAYSDLLSGIGIGQAAIIDLTDVQARAPNAQGKVIHEWTWEDGNISQYPIAVTYRGRDYLIITDELGSSACGDPNKPPYGYARIFDITTETSPILVSKIKTEALNPCDGQPAAGGGFGVGTHYCNVDRLDNPRFLSCGFWDGGVRVFDIRNPWRPKELAYFDTATANVPGLTRMLVEENELWVATIPSTFYVLKFADGVLDPPAAD